MLSLNYTKVRRPRTNFRCHRIDVRGHFGKAVHRQTRAPEVVDEGARMTSSKGGRLSAWCDVTGAGQSAVRSPGGRGHANPQCRHGQGRGQSVSAKPNQNKRETRLFPPARERLARAPSPRRPRGCEPRVATRRLQEAGQGAAAGMVRRGPRG